ATQLGIPGINDPSNSLTGGLPNIQISGLNSLGNGDWFPEILHENNYQLLDSFTYIHGRHSFKMGGDLRRRLHGFFQVQNSRGDLFYTGQFTSSDPNTYTVPLADFLIGYTQSLFRDAQTGTYGMRWWEFGTYLMDDYRVSSKLTLNLGVRYDIYTPMVEEHNRLANFDFQTGLFVAPGVTPAPVAPAMWRPTGRTSLRASVLRTRPARTIKPRCAAATAFFTICKPTR